MTAVGSHRAAGDRAGGPTPTISAWTRPASRSTTAATSPSTTSCAPTFPASGRWATATARAPSPTPPTMISRSSPQICWTTIRAGSATASQTYALFIDPPLGRAGHDRSCGAQVGTAGAGRQRPMTRVGRAVEKGETQGFMKVLVDADTKADSRRGDPRRRRRRGGPRHTRHDVGQGALHETAADHAHPPDRFGADPDHARRDEAAGVSVLRGSLRSHLRMREVGASTPRPLARSMGFRTGEVGANGPHPEVRAKRASKDAPADESAISRAPASALAVSMKARSFGAIAARRGRAPSEPRSRAVSPAVRRSVTSRSAMRRAGSSRAVLLASPDAASRPARRLRPPDAPGSARQGDRARCSARS